MSEENKKEVFETSESTPTQDVEKTVADLKKKIQEISNEAQAKKEEESSSGIDFAINEEKIRELREETAETLNRSVQGAKEKANDLLGNVDLSKTLNYLKTNAAKAVEQAKSSINEFSEREDVKKTIAAVKEKASDLGEKASGILSDENKEMLQEKLKEAGQKVKETSDAVTSYLQSDEVQDSIQNVKKTAKDLIDKCVETVRNFSEKKENQ